MEGAMLIVFQLVASAVLVLSSPVSRPNYDNIPQCMQPPVSGLCLAYIPSYYYNPAKERCDSFIYGGCQGNANRFFSFEECMSKCAGFKQENPDFKLILENGEDQESSKESERTEENICSQPSVMGPCRAMMPRFYFNGNKCESFIYGGCQGNGNNFKTVEECQTKCEVTASTEEVPEKASEEASSINDSQEASSKNDSEEISNESETTSESQSKEE